MKRLGHSSPRAALIYQHARDERDQAIAEGLDDIIKEAKQASRKARRDQGDDADPGSVGHVWGTT
ncbi:MAG TPA: hypothetical protein VEX15_13545 [Nocardioidaceae bacterium]|nr:hypothetical protein [Nocardioidaceae bacterium]